MSVRRLPEWHRRKKGRRSTRRTGTVEQRARARRTIELNARRKRRRLGRVLTRPKEKFEHLLVAEWLDEYLGINFEWFHTGAGYVSDAWLAINMVVDGVKKGIPDFMITRPCVFGGRRYVGVAIELKRRLYDGEKSGKGGSLTPEQKDWLYQLERRGWYVAKAHGAHAAIALLKVLYRGWNQEGGSPDPGHVGNGKERSVTYLELRSKHPWASRVHLCRLACISEDKAEKLERIERGRIKREREFRYELD